MLTQGEDVEVHALALRGWSISAIARHIGRDRKTVRAYLRGERQPDVRRRSVPDPLERFAPYIVARFADDPHLWLTTLHDELVPLGWDHGHQSLVRAVRRAGLRPRCEACAGVRGRLTIEIEHPPTRARRRGGRSRPSDDLNRPHPVHGWSFFRPSRRDRFRLTFAAFGGE